MTPARDHGRGTFVLDRVFPGIGRLKVASGTTSVQTFKRLNAMLDQLKAAGRLDIIQAIADRTVTPLEVWDAFRVSDLDRLPSADTIRLLWPTVRDGESQDGTGALEKWRATFHASVKHKASIKVSFDQLRKLSRADATVGDLPALLKRYRLACEKAETPRSFNLARSHAQAFLRDSLGRSHRLYRKVADTKPLPVDREDGRPMSVAELDALVSVLPPAHAAIAHDMAMTGMGPGEFWGRWESAPDRVTIHGTKRKGRKRAIPLLAAIGRPGATYRAFAQALGKVLDGRYSPYDLRRTFSHLMEEAGILRTRRKLYMGHGAADVTDLYERHEVDAYLARDGETLRAYLTKARTPEAHPKAADAHTTRPTTEAP